MPGLAVTGMLAIALAVWLRGLGHAAEWVIPADQILPETGQAWIVDLKNRLDPPWQPRGDSLFDGSRSDLLLLEDGRPLGPPHSLSDAVRADGGGRYVQWGRLLIFSTPDGSDPRHNGREYRVRFTAGVSRRHEQQALDAGHLLLQAALLGLLWRTRRTLPAALARAAGHLRRRLGAWLLAATIPTAAALFAWFALPPLWNNSDSVIWLIWQITFFPHHPPVYPFLMALLAGLTDDVGVMLRAAIIVQQVLQVFAVAYLATAFRAPWQVLLVALFATLGSALGLFGYGLFTEGIAHPLLLLFLGANARLWRDGLIRRVALALVVTLLVASLTRYLMIVLGAIPVAYLLIVALREHRLRAGWRPVFAMLGLMAGVVVMNSAVNAWLSVLLDAQQASVLGRPGIYRLQYTWQLLPEERRPAWLAALQARAQDPDVAAVLPLMAQVPDPWIGPRGAIAVAPALYARHPDELMTAGFKVFAFAPDPDAWRQWAMEFRRAVLGHLESQGGVGQVRLLLEGSADAVDLVFPRDQRALATAAATGTGAEDPATAARYRAIAAQPWVAGVDLFLPLEPARRGLLLGVSLLLLAVVLWRGRDRQLGSLMAALWLGALGYLLALTVITVVLPRYLAPVEILVWVSNAIGLLALGRAEPGDSKTAMGGT